MNYEDKKIVGIIRSNIDPAVALNIIGHLSVSIGKYSDKEIMGKEVIIDKSGVKHIGISKFPFIITKVKAGKLKTAIDMAKDNPKLLVVDYPKDMLDTREDIELVNSISSKENDKLEYKKMKERNENEIINCVRYSWIIILC